MAAPVGVSKTGSLCLTFMTKLMAARSCCGNDRIWKIRDIADVYPFDGNAYHPYEAAFVIIDFKGGGMVNQFAQLPHLLGAITNIDGNAINRSLKSIKAELQKRQKYFAQADVNHIDKYIQNIKRAK